MMGNQLELVKHEQSLMYEPEALQEFVTIRVNDQLFAISVLLVQDVLRGMKVTKIPLSPPEVTGSLNLRGRIVTAISLRTCFDLPKAEHIDLSRVMSVVVEYKNEFFSLIVDSVGEVITINTQQIENNPANLSGKWKEVASGIFKLEKELLVILDIKKLLKF